MVWVNQRGGPGHGGDADTGCMVCWATGCSPAQPQPQGQMCGMELRGLSLRFAVWLEHIDSWWVLSVHLSVCLPLSHPSCFPQI